MDILEIQKGKKKQPFSVIIAGTQGIGKSTFGAESPSPVFLGAEETGELDVNRFPQPKSLEEFKKQLNHLIANDLGFQTVVIDTLDSVETLVHRHLLATDPKSTGSMVAAHGSYGKAYDMSATELLGIRDMLKALRDQRGMNLILIAHTKKVIATDTILGMQYDTYELNLHQKAQSVFTDWVSAVLFANYVIHPQTGTNTDKIFASGDGERLLLTERRPGHIGKNRFNLPYEMPLKFDEFFKAYNKFYDDGPSAEAIKRSIADILCNIADPKLIEKINASIEKANDSIAQLQKIEARVRDLIV